MKKRCGTCKNATETILHGYSHPLHQSPTAHAAQLSNAREAVPERDVPPQGYDAEAKRVHASQSPPQSRTHTTGRRHVPVDAGTTMAAHRRDFISLGTGTRFDVPVAKVGGGKIPMAAWARRQGRARVRPHGKKATSLRGRSPFVGSWEFQALDGFQLSSACCDENDAPGQSHPCPAAPSAQQRGRGRG